MLVSLLTFKANLVVSSPAELVAMQDQIQVFVDNLIQQGNDWRQALIEGIPDALRVAYDVLVAFEIDILKGVLIHQGRVGKAQAAYLRQVTTDFRKGLKWLSSHTRLNQAMLKFFTDIIGPMIQEEYPLMAIQAAFEFDAAAAGACWTPVFDAVDAAMTQFDTDIATLITSAAAGEFYNSDALQVLAGFPVLMSGYQHILEHCAITDEEPDYESTCILNAVTFF